MKRNYPRDPQVVPRFAGVTTFFRLPPVEDWRTLDVALTGLPFDSGASYRPGARYGPRAIRDASSLLRPYNPVLDVDPYKVLNFGDAGDLSLSPMDLNRTFAIVEERFRQVYQAGVTPVSFGGDHSLTLPVLRGVSERYPRVSLLQMDAHLDTWDSYFGSKFTHGSFMIRAVEEGVIDPERSLQVGIRGPLFGPEDLQRNRDWGLDIIHAEEAHSSAPSDVIKKIREKVGDRPLYVSFDVDALDPAFTPGTGTPEVGGLTSAQAIEILRGLQGLNVVGADVVEVSPPYDQGQITAFLAARVGFELNCLIALARRG
ncbi:MAG: agmatinase [Nitrospinota bacterium]